MVYIGHSIELSYITLNWPLDKMPRQGLILTKAQEIYKGNGEFVTYKESRRNSWLFHYTHKKSSQREKR